jgi:ubiquinone/menaquinone biosynthesis C-methylase UbiE
MRHRYPIGLAPGMDQDATGQDARKYFSRNPAVRALISRWLGVLRRLVGDQPGLLIDVGMGEGLSLASFLPPSASAVGVEYRLGKLQEAVRRMTIHGVCGDAGMLPIRTSAADTVTCIEVLEHLTRPEAAIAELARIARGNCIVSVPWEPWFRFGNVLRGKNVRRLGNDPEHIHWFTRKRLKAALDPWFDEVELHTSFPWVMAVASKPRHVLHDP